MSFIGMNSTEGQVKPDVILPPLIVLQEYQTEIEIKCKVKSMPNVTVIWYLASTEDVSNDGNNNNNEKDLKHVDLIMFISLHLQWKS